MSDTRIEYCPWEVEKFGDAYIQCREEFVVPVDDDETAFCPAHEQEWLETY
jgi:hypothetical protein